MAEDNRFQIEIVDGVASTIAPKLDAIAKSAREAHSQVTALKADLQSIDASSLKTQVDSAQTSTAKLTTQLKTLSASNKDVASSTQQVKQEFTNSASSAIRLAEISNQLSQAKKNLNTATKNLAQAEKDLTSSQGQVTAQGRTIIESYRQQVQTAGSLVDRLSAAKKEATSFGKSQDDVGKAAHGAVTGVQATSGAIRVLEGNFGTNIRAAENFIVKILGMGPILQAAFPVVGAIALLGVIDILAEHVDTLREHWRNLGIEAQRTALKMLAAGRIELRGEHGTNERLKNLFIGRPDAPDIDVPDPSIATQAIRAELQLLDSMNRVNEAGKQGLDLQRQKLANTYTERDVTEAALIKQLKLRKDIQAEIQATVPIKPNTDVLIANLGPVIGGAIALAQKGGVQSKFPVDGKQYKELIAQAKEYDSAIAGLKNELEQISFVKIPEAMNKGTLAAARDGLKAAREQLKLFKDEFGKKEAEEGVLSPKARLDILQSQFARALPENKPELQGRVGVAQEAVDRQAATLELIKTRLQDQADAIGLVSDAQKAKHEIDKLDQVLMRNQIPIVGAVADALHQQTTDIVAASHYQRELNRVYEEANGPLITYKAGSEAIADLLDKKLITDAQAVIALNQLSLAYQRSQNPLLDYNKSIKDQIALFGKLGDELTVAAEIQKLQNQLRERGRALTESEIQALTKELTNLEKSKQVQQQLNLIYQQHQGTMEKLVLTYIALNEARKKGLITGEQERVELTKIKIQLADMQVQMHKGSGKDLLTSIFGDYLKDYKGFTREVTDLWKGTFSSIADGAANSIGRAIVYGEDLGESLKEVARSALSELISGMIKLGIQMLIQATIGKAISGAMLAVTEAEAAAVAAAWAPAAALASLATLGGNAAPADAAIVSTVGLAQIVGALHFNQGGIVPGYGDRDTVPILATPGEGILNRRAMQEFGASNLERLNRGVSTIQGPSSVGSGGGKGITINVEHDGSTGVQIEQTDPDTIRVIARTEVEKHAPRVVAGEMDNPNSKISKAVSRNTESKRRR